MGLFAALESKFGWIGRSCPFRLWFPVCAFVAGLFVWILDIAYWGDFGVFMLFLIVCPTIAVILIGVAAMNWRQWRYGLTTLAVLFVLSWVVETNGYMIHANVQWLLGSKKYKAQLLSETQANHSELKHMDWYGWGMAGQDTETYLVFDPTNSLSNAAKHKLSGKIPGVPCGVSNVLRLEEYWYSVVMYTNSAWEECD